MNTSKDHTTNIRLGWHGRANKTVPKEPTGGSVPEESMWTQEDLGIVETSSIFYDVPQRAFARRTHRDNVLLMAAFIEHLTPRVLALLGPGGGKEVDSC